jgi:ribosomal protein L37AE/L43A
MLKCRKTTSFAEPYTKMVERRDSMPKQETLKSCTKCHLGKMHKISLNESFTDDWKCDQCGYTEGKSPFDIIIENQTDKN